MTRTKNKTTKLKAVLVTSHSDHEGPLGAADTTGSGVSELYKMRDRLPPGLRHKSREDETLVYQEIHIPDIDYG